MSEADFLDKFIGLGKTTVYITIVGVNGSEIALKYNFSAAVAVSLFCCLNS